MLFDTVLPTIELSKLESILSTPATALLTKFMQYSKSFVLNSLNNIFDSRFQSQETIFFVLW